MICPATSHSVKKLKLPFMLLSAILVFTLLVACSPIAANRGRQMENLVSLVSTFAAPEDAALSAQIEGASQGSQEECQFIYVERLYGAQQPFEKIRVFYEQMLVAKGWQKNAALSDATVIEFERADGFVLAVYDDETASRMSHRQIEDAQQKFTTVYLLSVVYADPRTWKQCGQRLY
jgi:hypothetical protein